MQGGGVAAGVEGEVGAEGVELFAEVVVGGLVVVVAVDDVLYRVGIVDHYEGLGRGAETVAQPMDGGMGFQPEAGGEEAVEGGGDVVVCDEMGEGGGTFDKGRPEDERHMVRGEVVAMLTARGVVASDDEEGVGVAGEFAVAVNEAAQTVVGEEAGGEEGGKASASRFQQGGAPLVVLLQGFVGQAQLFVHREGGDEREVWSVVWVAGVAFEVVEGVGKEDVVVVAPPVGTLWRRGDKLVVQWREVVEALGGEVIVDAVEMEVAGIVGPGVVAGRFEEGEKAVVVGHGAELEAARTTYRASDGRYGSVAAHGGGEAVGPVESCGRQGVDKGHGSRAHHLGPQRLHDDDDNVGCCFARLEIG